MSALARLGATMLKAIAKPTTPAANFAAFDFVKVIYIFNETIHSIIINKIFE